MKVSENAHNHTARQGGAGLGGAWQGMVLFSSEEKEVEK